MLRLPPPRPLLDHHLSSLEPVMREWKSRNQICPSLLFTGASGIGKRTLSFFLGQWIQCEKSGWGKPAPSEEDAGFDLFGTAPDAAPETSFSSLPCGECVQCKRALSGNWVDFAEMEADAETGTLKIDQFRKLKASVGFGAHEGTYRIILIPDAERMTQQAANSVLKLLEEPPPGWLFFLTASDPSLVLPTVLSRCQTIRLKPLPPSVLRELLKSHSAPPIPDDRIEIASHLAQGSYGKALRVTSDEVWKSRKLIFDFIATPSTQLNPLVDWASQTQSDHLSLLMNQLETVCLDLIRMSLGEKSGMLNSDSVSPLRSHIERACRSLGSLDRSRDFWTTQAKRISRARAEALTPMNRKLLIQDILLPWLLSS